MNKRILSQEEREEILANSNVKSCSNKSITFTTIFKEKAVRQYQAGLTATEVFKQSGFNLNLIGKDIPHDCLRRWRKIVKHKGLKGLSESRGRKKSGKQKTVELSAAERLQYLEAEVKYLKAENSFLAQLRAKRAE
jgi:hypothetical protein